MIKAHSRRSFLQSVFAVTGMFAAGRGHELIAEPPYSDLHKTLRTPEWPELAPPEKEILDIPVSNGEARRLIDAEVNRCIYNNQNVRQIMGNYEVNGKPVELKRDWKTDFVLSKFYDGVIERAHGNNPGKTQLTIGNFWDAFLDHCSFHILKDCIRWLGAKAQGIELSDNGVLHPHQLALKNTIPLYEALMGKIETWPIFKKITFDPKKINIWDEDTVENIAQQMDRYDLLAIMKKTGVGTALLKPSPNALCVMPKNEAATKFLSARAIGCQAAQPNY